MVTKPPKGLSRGPEALLGPKVAEAASPNAEESGRTARQPSSSAPACVNYAGSQV
jgi:ParB family transcriptional regulator, chromosome partitioning protein